MGDIADQMFDDYVDGVASGEICAQCGRTVDWCECEIAPQGLIESTVKSPNKHKPKRKPRASAVR